MRLTNLWKPACIALVLLAATIYAILVVKELKRGTQLGEERREHADASRAFVEEEGLLGAIWAHRHHPYDVSWCPDYSPSFHKGCVDAVASGSVRKSAVQQ